MSLASTKTYIKTEKHTRTHTHTNTYAQQTQTHTQNKQKPRAGSSPILNHTHPCPLYLLHVLVAVINGIGVSIARNTITTHCAAPSHKSAHSLYLLHALVAVVNGLGGGGGVSVACKIAAGLFAVCAPRLSAQPTEFMLAA